MTGYVIKTVDERFTLDVQHKLWVPGTPQTKGSTRSYGRMRGDGSIGINTINDNPKAKEWQHRVAYFAKSQGVRPTADAWGLRISFFFDRPAGHVLTSKTSAGVAYRLSSQGRKRVHHTTKPDIDKALRVILDALTGVLYNDDSQVVETRVTKQYIMPDGGDAGVLIETYRLESWTRRASR